MEGMAKMEPMVLTETMELMVLTETTVIQR